MRAGIVAAGIVLAAVVAVAGCSPVTASDAPAAPGAIEGPTWRLVRLGEQDPAALAAVRGGVTLRFADGQLSAFAGCNGMGGTYTIAGDRLTLGPLVGTMMACAEPIMAIENAVKHALTGTLGFRTAAGQLTLTPAAGASAALVFAQEPAPRLEGVAWQVAGYASGRDAVVSPVGGTTLTLTFRDGTVAGHAGCNTFRAPYTVDGDRLTVAPAATTRKACGGDGVMAQERTFLKALESATRWQIERGRLDLHGAEGQPLLTARAGITP